MPAQVRATDPAPIIQMRVRALQKLAAFPRCLPCRRCRFVRIPGIQGSCASSPREHAKGVPVAADALDAPLDAAGPLGDCERTLVALFRRRKCDPIDKLTDRIEGDCRVRALVTIDAGDDAHTHLR